MNSIVAKFVEAGKPIFAFENTVHGNQGQEIFLSSRPNELVQKIRESMTSNQVRINHQEKMIQDGNWNVFQVDDKASFIIGNKCYLQKFLKISIFLGGN